MNDQSSEGQGLRSGQARPAGYGNRFGAYLLDALILFLPLLLIAVVLVDDLFDPQGTSTLTVPTVVVSAVAYAYHVLLESRLGRTLGKMALGLRVLNQTGSRPTLQEAMKRNVWLLASAVPVIGTVLSFVVTMAIPVTGSLDPAKRGWHDKFAGTKVIKV